MAAAPASKRQALANPFTTQPRFAQRSDLQQMSAKICKAEKAKEDLTSWFDEQDKVRSYLEQRYECKISTIERLYELCQRELREHAHLESLPDDVIIHILTYVLDNEEDGESFPRLFFTSKNMRRLASWALPIGAFSHMYNIRKHCPEVTSFPHLRVIEVTNGYTFADMPSIKQRESIAQQLDPHVLIDQEKLYSSVNKETCPNVEAIYFHSKTATDKICSILLKNFPELNEVRIGGCPLLTKSSLQELAKTKVRAVSFDGHTLSNFHERYSITSNDLANYFSTAKGIESVKLHHCDQLVSDQVANALLASTQRLKELRLLLEGGTSVLNPIIGMQLFHSMNELKTLAIESNEHHYLFTAYFVARLAPSTEEIDLPFAAVDDDVLDACAALPNLRRLSLWGMREIPLDPKKLKNLILKCDFFVLRSRNRVLIHSDGGVKDFKTVGDLLNTLKQKNKAEEGMYELSKKFPSLYALAMQDPNPVTAAQLLLQKTLDDSPLILPDPETDSDED